MAALALALGGCETLAGLNPFGGGGGGPQPGTPGFVRGFLGGVAAEDPAAALVARNVLSAGGTAVDAAVAAGFAMAVTLPSRVGLGGGGACLVFDPAKGNTEAVLFLPGSRNAVPPGADRPAAVPLLARGLFALHTRRPGRPFEELIAPAEQLARFGTEIGRGLAADLSAVAGPLFADPGARAALLQADVAFLIRRDGSVAEIRVVRPSGSYAFDLEAQGAIRVEYEGAVADLNRRPLTAAALAGVLGPLLGSVNMVNAPVVARERGIEVAETVLERSGEYQTLIRLSVTTERFERTVAGTLVAADKPRLVDVKGIAVEADFAPHMLYVTNQDKPGFIGRFGTTLADAGINIATFHLGRSAPGGDAICLVGLDGPMPDPVLSVVRNLPLVVQATPLQF